MLALAHGKLLFSVQDINGSPPDTPLLDADVFCQRFRSMYSVEIASGLKFKIPDCAENVIQL